MKRAAVLAALLLLLLPAAADARYLGSDPFTNMESKPLTGGLSARYDMSRYDLDYFIDAGGVLHPEQAVKSVMPELRHSFAGDVWDLVRNGLKIVFDLFALAFSLDILTGPHGVLGAFGHSAQVLHRHLVAAGWAVAAILLAAGWGMKKALADRKLAEAAGELALSFFAAALCIAVIASPVTIIGGAARFSNDAGLSFLSGFGAAGQGVNARDQIVNAMYRSYIRKPWVAIEFGGMRHCVDMRHLRSDGFPDGSIAPWDPNVTACINNDAKYADRFLQWPAGSDERAAEYQAIKDGEAPSDRQFPATYHLTKADSPAVDAMQAGGALGRIRSTLLCAVMAVGVVLIFGRLAVAALFGMMATLVFLALLAVGTVIALIPGPGYRIAKWSGEGLLLSIGVKMLVGLGAAIVTGASAALWLVGSAGGGDLMAFVFQIIFFWGLVIFRKPMIHGLQKAAGGAGSHYGRGAAAGGAAVMAATRPYQTIRKHMRKGGSSSGGGSGYEGADQESALAGDPGPASQIAAPAPARRRRGPVPLAPHANAKRNGNGNGNGHGVSREEELGALVAEIKRRDQPAPPSTPGRSSSPSAGSGQGQASAPAKPATGGPAPYAEPGPAGRYRPNVTPPGPDDPKPRFAERMAEQPPPTAAPSPTSRPVTPAEARAKPAPPRPAGPGGTVPASNQPPPERAPKPPERAT